MKISVLIMLSFGCQLSRDVVLVLLLCYMSYDRNHCTAVFPASHIVILHHACSCHCMLHVRSYYSSHYFAPVWWSYASPFSGLLDKIGVAIVSNSSEIVKTSFPDLDLRSLWEFGHVLFCWVEVNFRFRLGLGCSSYCAISSG